MYSMYYSLMYLAGMANIVVNRLYIEQYGYGKFWLNLSEFM